VRGVGSSNLPVPTILFRVAALKRQHCAIRRVASFANRDKFKSNTEPGRAQKGAAPCIAAETARIEKLPELQRKQKKTPELQENFSFAERSGPP
jgi:hypothetical protein